MEQETKQCPYCGEEILAVAKKCKHCGEWLEQPKAMTVCPVCGEETPADNPVCQQCGEPLSAPSPQNQASDVPFSLSLKKLSSAECYEKLKSWLPLIIGLYVLAVYAGQFVSYYFLGFDPDLDNGSMGKSAPGHFPFFGSLIITALIVWIGLKYSKNLTDPQKTQGTLKTWTAFSVAYLWWPLSVLSGWLFNLLEIDDVMVGTSGYIKWMMLCFYGLSLVAFVGWIFLIRKKDMEMGQTVTLFSSVTLLSVFLQTIAFLMSFGYFSFFPRW